MTRKTNGGPYRVEPHEVLALSPRIRNALIELKNALAADPGILHVQVTLDNVGAREFPPTVDVIPTWNGWEPGQTEPPFVPMTPPRVVDPTRPTRPGGRMAP